MFKKKISQIWEEINALTNGKDVDEWQKNLPMGRYSFNYAEWALNDWSQKYNIDVARLLREACQIENLTSLSADAKIFLLWRRGNVVPQYDIEQKLNGDFTLRLRGLYFTV